MEIDQGCFGLIPKAILRILTKNTGGIEFDDGNVLMPWRFYDVCCLSFKEAWKDQEIFMRSLCLNFRREKKKVKYYLATITFSRSDMD